MDVAVPERLAEDLAPFLAADGPVQAVDVVWHAGEPLLTGREHLRRLLEPFEDLRTRRRVRHSLQTNGTLVTAEWCELFADHDVRVGVSIDGPRWANVERRTLSGAETFDRTMRGIARLREHGVPFSVIAVVSLAAIPTIVRRADEYLAFFREIGAGEVGFNIEEHEGHHRVAGSPGGAVAGHRLVREFWSAVFDAWLTAGGRPRVRDFHRVLDFARASLAGTWREPLVDLFPTITWRGEVVLLSPELAGYQDESYADFVVGNLYEESLSTILTRAWRHDATAQRTRYVAEFVAGTAACRDGCRYFAYCQGGQAGNRYFEHGTFLANETDYCRNSRQAPFDAVMGTAGDDIEPRVGASAEWEGAR